MKLTELEALVKKAIPNAEIEIKDLAGDDNHYSIVVKSDTFRGKSRIEQHQIVYDALAEKMGNKLHALQVKTIST
tara:strand:+ start:341 stop:565 length:225 start_codon:yes stop_codon:yes gene_type:complete